MHHTPLGNGPAALPTHRPEEEVHLDVLRQAIVGEDGHTGVDPALCALEGREAPGSASDYNRAQT
eukprot:13281069-Alexandrium_andersonii.AAC.1